MQFLNFIICEFMLHNSHFSLCKPIAGRLKSVCSLVHLLEIQIDQYHAMFLFIKFLQPLHHVISFTFLRQNALSYSLSLTKTYNLSLVSQYELVMFAHLVSVHSIAYLEN